MEDFFRLTFFSYNHSRDKTLPAFLERFGFTSVTLITRLERLCADHAHMADGSKVVAITHIDDCGADVLQILYNGGCRLILCFCAGFNMVDLEAAERLGITVATSPDYSPNAIAEFAISLLLNLMRKTHVAISHSREQNFRLDGLMGVELTGKTVGVLGVGKIGFCFAKIAHGFGCKVLGYDLRHNPSYADVIEYRELNEMLPVCDIVCIFLPLFPSTKHIINEERLSLMKKGAYLVNVGRGAVIDSKALIGALKAKRLGGVALDVYEFETHVFMQDFSEDGVPDEILTRLMAWPCVVVTPHIAFFTQTSVEAIFTQSCLSLKQFLTGEEVERAVRSEVVAAK
mmetsp:Transcript_14112/g.26439  ORF Transcript_14112/g.26439 Transcript_14112/m.26439 type:complete len:343 (+) Transcript_14112:2398-3426(+)